MAKTFPPAPQQEETILCACIRNIAMVDVVQCWILLVLDVTGIGIGIGIFMHSTYVAFCFRYRDVGGSMHTCSGFTKQAPESFSNVPW